MTFCATRQETKKKKKIRGTQICSKPVVAADIVSSNRINMQPGGGGGEAGGREGNTTKKKVL